MQAPESSATTASHRRRPPGVATAEKDPSRPWYEGLPPPNLRRRAAKPWLLDLFLSNRRRCEHRHDDTSCEEAVRRPHPHHTALSLQLRPFGLLANQRPFSGGSPSSLPPSAGRRLAG